MHHLQAPRFACCLEDGGESAVDVQHQGDGQPDGAADENEELRHVRPEHGRESAERGVERGQQAHAKDGSCHGNAGDDRQSERRGIDHQSQPAESREQEQTCDGRPRGGTEAVLDIFVGGRDAQAAIVGIEEEDQHRGHGGAHEADDDQRDVLAVGLPGQRKVGHGAGHGGIHAHGHRQPGHVASGQEVVLGGLLASGEIEANAHHAGEVDDQDQNVEKSEMHQGSKD